MASSTALSFTSSEACEMALSALSPTTTLKSFSESITADGCTLTDGDSKTPTYDQLKELMLKGESITASYNVREGSSREGKTAGGYTGSYIITALDLDGQAGDDAKYSLTLENSGAVTKVNDGLSSTAS